MRSAEDYESDNMIMAFMELAAQACIRKIEEDCPDSGKEISTIRVVGTRSNGEYFTFLFDRNNVGNIVLGVCDMVKSGVLDAGCAVRVIDKIVSMHREDLGNLFT